MGPDGGMGLVGVGGVVMGSGVGGAKGEWGMEGLVGVGVVVVGMVVGVWGMEVLGVLGVI